MRPASPINTIYFIGNFLPRQCGIATFTTDLCESIATESPSTTCKVVAMNDLDEGYEYPPRVRFAIAQEEPNDYNLVAEYLNMHQVDMICLQHEYGIFGGLAGAHILDLLKIAQRKCRPGPLIKTQERHSVHTRLL